MPSPSIWLLPAIMSFACGCARSPAPTPEPSSSRDAALGGPLESGVRDALPADAGPDDISPPDPAPDAAPTDARPDVEADAAEDDARLPCPTFAAPPVIEGGLPDVRVRATLSLGAPPTSNAAAVLDLDGDPEGRLEAVVVRGGRVEVAAADGRPWWRTAVVDARALVGVVDLDGDGRREVIVTSRQTVMVFDGLTGDRRWTSPSAPFGDDRPLVAIQRAELVDLDGDELPDLYLTDSGCGDEGTGRAAAFGFAGPELGTALGVIDGPRLNGRCTRWHTLTALDGLPTVMVTDGDGLNAFDPLTGARRLCGGVGGPPNGPLPHRRVRAGVEPGWMVFLPDEVAAAGVEADAICPGGSAITARWRRALPGLTPTGAVISDLDDDGYDDLLVSAITEQQWQTLRVDGRTGQARVLADDARLLGAMDDHALLVAMGDGPAPGRFGALQRLDLTPDGVRSAWPLPIARSRVMTRPGPLDATAEWSELLTADGDIIVLREGLTDDRPSGVAHRLQRIDGAGQLVASYALDGDPGFVTPVAGGFAVSLAGGRIALLDDALDPRFEAPDGRPPLRAASETPAVTPIFDGARVRPLGAVAGVVALLDETREAAPVIWQVPVGMPSRGGPSPVQRMLRHGRADAVLVRDALAGDAAWSLFEGADGERLWRHRLDPALFRPVGHAVVAMDADGAIMIVRADLVLRPADWSAAESECAVTLGDPDADRPADACPDFEVKPRVVRGLDPETGACRWRHILRPAFPCGGPSNQALSAVDGDGDGAHEAYLTETNALRAFDPRTGAETAIADLGAHDNGSVRGGGWIRGGPGGLVRVGGNGPIEVFDADLGARWSAITPEGLRLQSWIRRDAAALGDRIWASPGAGWPLIGWSLADGREVARVGIRGGEAVPDPPLAAGFDETRAPVPVTDVDGAGGDGLLLAGADGVLHALGADGAPIWRRVFDAAIGPPVVVAPDADGPRALWVSTDDGRILVHGPPGPAATPAVWDLPCPGWGSCDPDDDIDRTEATDRLCAAWVPVEGVAGAVVRVLGPNGAVIAETAPVDDAFAHVDGLALIPGVRYAIEVSTLSARGVRGQPRASDGVVVVNDAPPTVALVADPGSLSIAEQPVVAALVATDDDRLAGWRLEVRGLDDTVVRRLASGPLAHRIFETEVRWNLEDRAKRPMPPGTWRLVATVTDRAGNAASAEAAIEVCDGACP